MLDEQRRTKYPDQGERKNIKKILQSQQMTKQLQYLKGKNMRGI